MRDRILSAVKKIRNQDMETNAFFLPGVWVEMIENFKHICCDDLIAVIKEEKDVNRLYYMAKNRGVLNKLSQFVDEYPNEIIVDILSDKPQETYAYEFLSEIGFEEYSLFERRDIKKQDDDPFVDVRIKFADLSVADKIYELIRSEFDVKNSYLPTFEDIKRAIEKQEIVYIGKPEDIQAFAFFENTNRTTVTLRYIFVNSQHRNEHYGTVLLSYGMQRGSVRYVLWVDTVNEPAKHLYDKFGYKYNGLKDMTLRLGGSKDE